MAVLKIKIFPQLEITHAEFNEDISVLYFIFITFTFCNPKQFIKILVSFLIKVPAMLSRYNERPKFLLLPLFLCFISLSVNRLRPTEYRGRDCY